MDLKCQFTLGRIFNEECTVELLSRGANAIFLLAVFLSLNHVFSLALFEICNVKFKDGEEFFGLNICRLSKSTVRKKHNLLDQSIEGFDL